MWRNDGVLLFHGKNQVAVFVKEEMAEAIAKLLNQVGVVVNNPTVIAWEKYGSKSMPNS